MVRDLVNIIAGTIKSANHAYTDVVKGMQQRKLMRLKGKEAVLKLRQSELDFIAENAETMGRVLGITDVSSIHARTGNPYITLKILLSLFRRVRTLAEYQLQGKADFVDQQHNPTPTSVQDSPRRPKPRRRRTIGRTRQKL